MYTYMQHESGPSVLCLLFSTLGAVQGLFFVRDFCHCWSFEVMTVASFFWVIHRQDRVYASRYFTCSWVLLDYVLQGALLCSWFQQALP